jgi:hypothetical protein
LRQLLRQPGVEVAIGIPASGALLLGADGKGRTVGPVFAISEENADFAVIDGEIG